MSIFSTKPDGKGHLRNIDFPRKCIIGKREKGTVKNYSTDTVLETALREKDQRKQLEQLKPIKTAAIEEKITREPMEPAVPPDAMMVTSPEIKDLLRFMEENPLYKFQLLTHFYRYKQEGQKAGEISFEDNRQKKETGPAY